MKQITLIIVLISLASYTWPHFSKPITPRPDRSTQTWDSTRNWKIYKLQNFDIVFRIPTDSLPYLGKKALSDDTMHVFLSQSSQLGTSSPLWMGCYLASYEDAKGKTRKTIISHYGGSFYCQSDNAYFQVSSADQTDWLNYLSQCYMSIPEADKK